LASLTNREGLLKGFPNQIADFGKLAKGMQVAVELEGPDAKNDGLYGVALVHAGVAGTGHQAKPAEQYLAEQNLKPTSSQGHRTAARGLRELYRKLGLIEDNGPNLFVTALGRQAAGFADAPLDAAQSTFWRTALSNMSLGHDANVSHPYQILLRLVARYPGISRARCALALEARDDSSAEMNRIGELVLLDEEAIIEAIGATRSNWDNAKKMLPRFAEQLGDVVRIQGGYVLGNVPGGIASTRDRSVAAAPRVGRVPRSSRSVTPESIARAGLAERSEPALPTQIDPAQMEAAIATRADRVRRHNLIVRAIAGRLAGAGFSLYEDPFDVLAVGNGEALLLEIKTLDGSEADERDRVRDALAQLLYYEAFVTQPHVDGAPILKLACFESRPSNAHIDWLRRSDIVSVWQEGDEFLADEMEADWLD